MRLVWGAVSTELQRASRLAGRQETRPISAAIDAPPTNVRLNFLSVARAKVDNNMSRGILRCRVHDAALDPSLMLLCSGFELGAWRVQDLVDDSFQRHLASFALSWTEFQKIDGESAGRALRRAAEVVYETNKYARRGEFGELFLHAIAKDFFGAQPAVSKIYYKDSRNDTVKGFDCVHIVETAKTLRSGWARSSCTTPWLPPYVT